MAGIAEDLDSLKNKMNKRRGRRGTLVPYKKKIEKLKKKK